MNQVILIPILFISFLGKAQSKFDNKIIVTMPDTVGIYIKTRVALANSNFIVRENYNMDTVSTHLKELDAIKGYMATNAIISGNTVTFSGIYGLKRISAWGYTRLPGGYTRIIFYSGSKTWRELLGIAIKMRGEISYSD